MIVVKVEVWPYGEKEKAHEIATAKIWNRGGNIAYADYGAEFSTNPENEDCFEQLNQKVSVEKHPRHLSVWRLVQSLLNRLE